MILEEERSIVWASIRRMKIGDEERARSLCGGLEERGKGRNRFRREVEKRESGEKRRKDRKEGRKERKEEL